MENLLREYLEKSFRQSEGVNPCGTGPLITISREFGCPSKLIGQQLTNELNKMGEKSKSPKWRFISKEIVVEAARELELKPIDMKFLLSSGGKGLMEDVLASFSQPYVNKHRIRKTITNVIITIAQKGHVVIVGRGGVAVLQGCQNALHIRLQAPLEWRINEVCKMKNIPETLARNLAHDADMKRSSLMELILKKKFDLQLFDLILNCSTISKEEIVKTVINLMEAKKMIGNSAIFASHGK